MCVKCCCKKFHVERKSFLHASWSSRQEVLILKQYWLCFSFYIGKCLVEHWNRRYLPVESPFLWICENSSDQIVMSVHTHPLALVLENVEGLSSDLQPFRCSLWCGLDQNSNVFLQSGSIFHQFINFITSQSQIFKVLITIFALICSNKISVSRMYITWTRTGDVMGECRISIIYLR